MKFKKDRNDNDARTLTFTDYDHELTVTVYEDKADNIVIGVLGAEFGAIGISRKKAIKLANAIIKELDQA